MASNLNFEQNAGLTNAPKMGQNGGNWVKNAKYRLKTLVKKLDNGQKWPDIGQKFDKGQKSEKRLKLAKNQKPAKNQTKG